jgi:heme a synthase
VILSIALCVVDPRRWVRLFAVAAVIAVCLQGVLGGLRVVLIKDEIGVFHALLAQSFFVAISILAIVTSRSFAEKRWADYEPHPTLRWWALAGTALVFVQLGIGATMRHEHIGLSISDFPLSYGSWLPDTSPEAIERINAERVAAGEMKTNALQIWVQMAHRILALLIAVVVTYLVWKARRSARAIRLWSMVWVAMIVIQIGLGAWTIWSKKAADVATAHMALGALSLLVGAWLAFRLFCGARIRDFILPDPLNRGLIERVA